jgi:hypothetical protein
MESPLIIPLAVFAIVALLVAITKLAKIRDKEMEVQQRLHLEQMEHQRKMQELERELERVKKGGEPPAASDGRDPDRWEEVRNHGHERLNRATPRP